MFFHILSVLLAITSLFSPATASVIARQHVKNGSTESAPNPIAQQYPFSVTGTINGTLSVLPIPYALARSLIPAKYAILKNAYECLIPGFPRDSYPLVLRTCVDHDVQVAAANLGIPDFQLTKLQFPFVDLLGDGYSTFTYIKDIFITETSTVALDTILQYGENPVPATFTPLLEAYSYSGKDAITYSALVQDKVAIETVFRPQQGLGPWNLNFYSNVTNQPQFGNGTLCIRQINYFNTTLSTGKNAAVGIQGDVTIQKPYFPTTGVFRDVSGIKVDVAFQETGELQCETLKGYSFDGGI